MVLPAATPSRPSNAHSDCDGTPWLPEGVVQETALPSEAVKRRKGATLPSSSARNEPLSVSSGPGDRSKEEPGGGMDPTSVEPTAPPTVQRSPTRRSRDAVTACLEKLASWVVPCVVSSRWVVT